MVLAAPYAGRASLARHLPAMDGLRAVAILLVFAVHSDLPLLGGGGAGVDLFFVISGFLITRILLREHRDAARVDLVAFYANRVVRLAPAMALMCACFLLYFSLLGGPRYAAENVLPAITFVADYTRSAFHRPDALAHQWSLSVEEQFYLLWPPLLIACLRMRVASRTLLALLAAGIAVVCAWRAWLFAHGAPVTRLYDGFDCHSDGIMLGCMLALVGGATMARLARIWPLGLAGLALWLVLGAWDSPFLYLGGQFAIAACAATLVAACAAAGDSVPGRMLATAPMRAIGRVSYGMYVWHYPVLAVLEVQFGLPAAWAMLLGGVISTLVASVSFLAIERPLMIRRRAMTPPLKRLLACCAPAQLAAGMAYLAMLYRW